MSKTDLNDEKVLNLKKKIEEKKAKIGTTRFSPITNCIIEFRDGRKNIQTLKNEDLTILLIELNSFRMSMKDLGIKNCTISGYDISDWIQDIKSRLAVIVQKKEEAELKTLEKKLDTLLSSDKRTELELDSIEKLL
jgi:hypothetical protein